MRPQLILDHFQAGFGQIEDLSAGDELPLTLDSESTLLAMAGLLDNDLIGGLAHLERIAFVTCLSTLLFARFFG
jgi:hypothetical protein